MTPCAHCGKEVGVNRYGPSGNLCPDCLVMWNEYRNYTPEDDLDPEPVPAQGKRPDQLSFSIAVLVAVALIAFGWVLGSTFALWQFGL